MNELRLYDLDGGYTFNMAEFGIRGEPAAQRELVRGVGLQQIDGHGVPVGVDVVVAAEEAERVVLAGVLAARDGQPKPERMGVGGVPRTAAQAPGLRTAVWETTATLRYKIWRGLAGRLEYRHDQATERVFKVTNTGPTSKAEDTLTLAFHYLFF